MGINQLEELIRISHLYGEDPDYVIAGGGNTSFKNRERIWIKASGIPLSGITEDGFVCLSREKLVRVESRSYSKDPATREEEVRMDIQDAVIAPANLRPSVETSLHNLIGYAYVVHTHPTLVNGLLCANHAEREVKDRFGDSALYVEYTDPGYVLFKEMQERIRAYRNKNGKDPAIVFLQNHGVFVSAGSTGEVRSIYGELERCIDPEDQRRFPVDETEEYRSDVTMAITSHMGTKGLITRSVRSNLIDHFTRDEEQMKRISKPFTPDIIVYCKSSYLFMGKDTDPLFIPAAIEKFEQSRGYFPRIILVEGSGMTVVEKNRKSLQIVQDVFCDLMKISFITSGFGGPHFMTREQIRFIDSWEVEQYRRRVAGGS